MKHIQHPLSYTHFNSETTVMIWHYVFRVKNFKLFTVLFVMQLICSLIWRKFEIDPIRISSNPSPGLTFCPVLHRTWNSLQNDKNQFLELPWTWCAAGIMSESMSMKARNLMNIWWYYFGISMENTTGIEFICLLYNQVQADTIGYATSQVSIHISVLT
jgi:hypothetical protein